MYRFHMLSDMQPICPVPMTETVRGFSRYARTVPFLPLPERKKLDKLAEYIFASFAPGCVPVLSVDLLGHADTDLQKGHVFEHDISVERAREVETYLRNSVAALSKDFKAAPGSPIPTQIAWTHDGVGATQPAPENAGKDPNRLSEAQRALNRRVDVILGPQLPNQPTKPWTFDPTDAQQKLQKAIDDFWNRQHPRTPGPPPPPPPSLPPWFWKDLPKLDDKQNWKKWQDDVEDWCQQNHVDPDPILDTFKDLLQLPDGSPGPIDSDFEKELRRRQVTPVGPPIQR